MFEECLSKNAKNSLALLGKSGLLKDAYLSGHLTKPGRFSNINICDIKDIAPMKMAAISDRGAKRDFIDLYFIIAIEKILTLQQIFDLYDRKFKVLHQNKLHILKSLVYFNDADVEKIPKMIKNVDWQEVKKFFEKEVKIFLRL